MGGFTSVASPSPQHLGQQAIAANYKKLTVLSADLANQGNETRAQRSVEIIPVTANGVTIGVQAGPETRITDPIRVEDLRYKNMDLTRSEIIEKFQSEIQNQMGTTQDKNSLGTQLTSIKTSLKNLADAPELPGTRNDIVRQFAKTTESINNLSNFIQRQRKTSEDGISDHVSRINSILQEISTNNMRVVRASAGNTTMAGELEAQDNLLQELSGYLNFKVFSPNNSTAYIYLPNGEPLVNDVKTGLVEFTPAAAIRPEDTPANLGQIRVNGNDITNQISGGLIGGHLFTRDKLLPDLQSELDEFTEKFRDQMNTIHNRGTGIPGRQSMVGAHTYPNATTGVNFNGSIRVSLIDNSTKEIIGGSHVTYDIDLTDPAITTIDDVRAAIDALPGLSATLTPSDPLAPGVNLYLTVSADSADHTPAITSLGNSPVTEAVSGLEFSHHFGLNNLLTTADRFVGDGNPNGRIGLAQKVSLRPDIRLNSDLFSRGQPYAGGDTVPQEKGFRSGDTSTIRDFITGLDMDLSFASAGKLSPRQESLVQFGNTIWHNAATDAAASREKLESDQTIFENSKGDLLARVGVNPEQTTIDIMQVMSAIQMHVKLISVGHQVIDYIMNITGRS